MLVLPVGGFVKDGIQGFDVYLQLLRSEARASSNWLAPFFGPAGRFAMFVISESSTKAFPEITIFEEWSFPRRPRTCAQLLRGCRLWLAHFRCGLVRDALQTLIALAADGVTNFDAKADAGWVCIIVHFLLAGSKAA